MGQIHCCFVMGKSRVRTLRAGVTVPKLELAAATLAVKVKKLILKELEGRLQIDGTYFWTDSYLVFRYIRNERKRFTIFVAKRVAVIREGSQPSQWYYVKSEDNPADYAEPTNLQKLQSYRFGEMVQLSYGKTVKNGPISRKNYPLN